MNTPNRPVPASSLHETSIFPSLGSISGRHSRRDFIRRLGGGIVVLVAFGDRFASAAGEPVAEAAVPRGGRPGLPSDFNAFLRIAPDGRVTCFTGKIEMGQGPITSLAQMLADELDVPYESVDVLMGDTDLCPWDAGTWGSMTTRFFGPPLRMAAAEARGVLLEVASEKLGVPVENLLARDGVISVRDDDDRQLTYGALAAGESIERHVHVTANDLKDVSQFRVMGQPKLRRDSRAKVTGAAAYAADVRLPDMLYAKVLRPPAHGSKLKKVDTSRAKALDGVKVVEEGSFVAVLHALPDVAQKALDAVKADFDVPSPTVDDSNIHEHLLRAAPKGSVVAEGGDLEAGRRSAAKTVKTRFLDSYYAHAAMETHAALAKIEGDKATVWASTQNPFGARDQIAHAIGFPADQVRVITPFVGGGFGGKSENSQAVEAARLAKAVGRPVQVMRSREEEFFLDTFRPAAVVDIAAGLDATGAITFWDYDVLFAGQRGSEQFYAIPNHRTMVRPRGWHAPDVHPFATGAWRAPSNNTNSFARESQIDMLAAAAGVDPIAFRLKHLRDARMIRVLNTAAKHFEWSPAVAPSRRGIGVACGIDAGSYVAVIAEVSVDRKSGKVGVKRVVAAQEMGIVINPQGATIQMEGCVTMGLGYALSEEVHFKGGKILDLNFDRYEIPRCAGLPEIETVLVEANDIPPQGGGEPCIIVMGAVIANAIFDATGARLLQMPMTPKRVKAALAKV